jgi:hypothetical protein
MGAVNFILNLTLLHKMFRLKGKAIPVTGRGGPQGC